MQITPFLWIVVNQILSQVFVYIVIHTYLLITQGPFIQYVRTFLDFFDPPSPLCTQSYAFQQPPQGSFINHVDKKGGRGGSPNVHKCLRKGEGEFVKCLRRLIFQFFKRELRSRASMQGPEFVVAVFLIFINFVIIAFCQFEFLSFHCCCLLLFIFFALLKIHIEQLKSAEHLKINKN